MRPYNLSLTETFTEMKLLLFAVLTLLFLKHLPSSNGSNPFSELTVVASGKRAPPRGGFFLQISTHSIRYMTQMMEAAIPKLLINYSIPDISATTFSLNDVIIKNMSTPKVSAGYLNQTGVYSELIFPQIELSGQFQTGIGWFSKRGAFRALTRNLTLQIMLTATRGSRNQPLFQIPTCRGETGEILSMFSGGFSGVLNTVRPFMETCLTEKLDKIVCDVISKATQFFEEEITKRTENHSGTQFSPSLLCGGFKGKKGDNNRPLPDFDINFEMTGEPFFTDSHALIGMDGELLYKGGSAHMEMPQFSKIHWGYKMLSFQLTEYVPNTFFHHIYTHKLGVIRKSLELSDPTIPEILRTPLSLMCQFCKIHMEAGPLESPVTRFTAEGLMLTIVGQLRIIVDGPFKQFDLLNANLEMEVTTHLVVRRNMLYGRGAKLVDFRMSVKEVGISGLLGQPISDAMELMVPQELWPCMRERLHFVKKQKGIRLPVVCGVRLQNTDIKYFDGAVLVDTDFRYNLGRFMRKFKQHVLNNNKT